jgi:glycosyltransferase involved in cell wall biosynthesis
MKILIIAHKVPFPPRGGATLRNFNLLKECADNNEIHLFAFTQEPYLRDPAELRKSVETLKRYCKHVEVFRIPTDGHRLRWYLLLFFNTFSLTPYSAWRFRSNKMIEAIKMHLKQQTFDLVEIGTIALADYADLTPDLPKLLIHHNVESELLYRRANTAGNLLARAYLSWQADKLRRFEKKALSSFDHHTVVSERDKNVLAKSNSAADITVIDNGVDTDYFRPSDQTIEPDTLVYAGSMSWYPNAEAMLYFAREIWPLLRNEVPSIVMNVIGSHAPKGLIEVGKRDSNFKLHGFVDDVRPIIHKAGVYVVPITVGGGTRLKILDAMAMGKAIVSTSIGCEGIRTRHGENILIADDPKEFCREIVRLLNDENLRRRLGTNARKTAEEYYSWKKIAPRLNEIYRFLGEKRSNGNRG